MDFIYRFFESLLTKSFLSRVSHFTQQIIRRSSVWLILASVVGLQCLNSLQLNTFKLHWKYNFTKVNANMLSDVQSNSYSFAISQQCLFTCLSSFILFGKRRLILFITPYTILYKYKGILSFCGRMQQQNNPFIYRSFQQVIMCLSVHLPILCSCVLPTDRKIRDIAMKFGIPTYFRPEDECY